MAAVHGKVTSAIRSGAMDPPAACEACGVGQSLARDGRRRVIWHHWSYAPEHATDCYALCRSCHARVHHGRIPEPRTGRVYVSSRPRKRDSAAARVVAFLAARPNGATGREVCAALGHRGIYLHDLAIHGLVRREPTGRRGRPDQWLYFTPTP